MLKRKSIILSVLVVAFLSFPQSAHIVGAEVQTINTLHTGTTTAECILLQEEPPIYIKVIRNKNNLCAEKVEQHKTYDCSARVDEIPYLKGILPKNEAYGIGNQVCPEAIVVYKNSPRCYEYVSGGRTRYIPRG